MTGNAKQKIKLLSLYRMLERETDAEHGLTMTGILQRLADEGITAERKGIYRDLDVLRSFGCTISTIPRFPVEYTLERTGITISDLVLLADAVQSSRFISERSSTHLIRQITSLASTHEQAQLAKTVKVLGRVRSQSESVLRNVDAIHAAQQADRKIRFLAYRYGADLKREAIHDGRPLVLTPVDLVLADGIYYLVGWSDDTTDSTNDADSANDAGEFAIQRVDRMRQLRITDEPATHNERIEAYGLEDFSCQAFGVLDGPIVEARLRIQPDAMDAVVDRFGTDIPVRAFKDGSAEARVTVRKSTRFFGWIAGADGGIRISGPKALAEEYRAWLKTLAGLQ